MSYYLDENTVLPRKLESPEIRITISKAMQPLKLEY